MGLLMAGSDFSRRLRRYYFRYTSAFLFFIILLSIGEYIGMSQTMIGYVFLFATIAIYAGIGVISLLTRPPPEEIQSLVD